MAKPNDIIYGDDEELMGILSLAGNFMLMNFDIGKDANPEDAPDGLTPEVVELLVRGKLQELILNIQQEERRPYLKGSDLPVLLEKVMVQCKQWLYGDFR